MKKLRPYKEYYVDVLQDIVVDRTDKKNGFTIGAGAQIYLPAASKELIQLLRQVYDENKSALHLKGASVTYLLAPERVTKNPVKRHRCCLVLPEQCGINVRFFSPRHNEK